MGVPCGSHWFRFATESVDQFLDDLRQFFARLGQAIEVVLALAARGDDTAVPQQGQVVADGGLAHVHLLADGADMLLTLGEHQDHLQPRRVADLFQEHRRPLRLLEPLVGPFLRPARLGRRGRRTAGHARHRGYSEFKSPVIREYAAPIALGMLRKHRVGTTQDRDSLSRSPQGEFDNAALNTTIRLWGMMPSYRPI